MWREGVSGGVRCRMSQRCRSVVTDAEGRSYCKLWDRKWLWALERVKRGWWPMQKGSCEDCMGLRKLITE